MKFESSLFASNCVIKYNYLLTAVNTPVDMTANCTLGDLRLVNGTSDLEGRVEVCFGNLWGTICHNSWDNRDAGVICKQLFNSSFGKLLKLLYLQMLHQLSILFAPLYRWICHQWLQIWFWQYSNCFLKH